MQWLCKRPLNKCFLPVYVNRILFEALYFTPVHFVTFTCREDYKNNILEEAGAQERLCLEMTVGNLWGD